MRKYRLIYWNKAGTLIDTVMRFKNYNLAYRFLYSHDFKPLTVKYIK